MLEEIIRVGNLKPAALQREVAPVSPYPRINAQQERQEGYQQPAERRAEPEKRTRRRFTAMRDLIEALKGQAQITRVDFNIANQELIDLGLSIAEEELIAQLLQLKIPLASVEELIRQLRQRSVSPTLVSGRDITPAANLFPVFVEELAEYLLRFDDLQVIMGSQHAEIFAEINSKGRYLVEHNRLRLHFARIGALPAFSGEPLNLTISIQVGAVEVDDNGRRAIFYQRPDQSYGLYSDKSISLSI